MYITYNINEIVIFEYILCELPIVF